MAVRFATVWLAVAVLTGCGLDEAPRVYELSAEQASQYATAYVAVVVADADGDDLELDAGEHVVIRTNWDHRTDMGGWWIEDLHGNRLPLGFSRQIDPNAEVRVHTSCGEDTDDTVFACVGEEVLDDDGDVLVLRDSGGSEVARFEYGTSAD